MSSNVFPDLPGLDIQVTRRSLWATPIQTATSGKEQRASLQATPRYEYAIKANVLRSEVAAPTPYQALNELTVLLGFIDDHKGAWDSFLFNDPVDGVQRRVRFVEDSLSVTRVADKLWSADLTLISVK
jgi:hypothetical protein